MASILRKQECVILHEFKNENLNEYKRPFEYWKRNRSLEAK